MRARFLRWLAGTTLACSCAHPRQQVEIAVHRSDSANPDTLVRVDIPADWRPLVPSPSRAEYLSPDNRSRAYVRAMPVEADAKGCPKMARRYASDFIQAWGGPPQTRVTRRTSVGETVDFELRRTEPRPDGEIIWARVMCREGALAITSCTVPATRARELASECRQIVESLQVLPRARARATLASPCCSTADSRRATSEKTPST